MSKARDLANAATALSAVSATELGYLDGVSSSIQTQLGTKASTTYVDTSIAAIPTPDLSAVTTADVMDSL
jgi:hypothetical protein